MNTLQWALVVTALFLLLNVTANGAFALAAKAEIRVTESARIALAAGSIMLVIVVIQLWYQVLAPILRPYF
jgi:hypothetical protein